MTENAPTDRFKKLTVIVSTIGFIIMFLGIWYTISVTYSNVGNIDQRLDKKIVIQNEIHEDIDRIEIEFIKEINRLELRIKTLETEIEYLKK